MADVIEGLECLRYVAPADIDIVWPAILPGLERLMAKGARRNRPAGWTPEQLNGMLKSGQFDLLLGYWQGKYIGFTMITKLPAEFTGEAILFVMTGYTLNREARDAAFRDYDRIAKARDIKRIAFCSAFSGWKRIAPTLGFSPQKVWFEKRVD